MSLQAILIRLVAVLTVLLGTALMAVSVYAAKTVPASLPSPDAPVSDAVTAPEETDGGSATPATVAPEEVDSTASPSPAPKDPAAVRFAPPERATRVGTGAGAASNVSPRVRVWSVPSVRSGVFGAAGAQADIIPSDQLAAMQQIGGAMDIPWQVLAGIARVESDFGRNMATSSAGAIGYGQFLPEEWTIYGAGGNPYDYRDALLAMTRYLLVAGAPETVPDAIYAYNHDWSYVELVLSYASSYGYQSTRAGSDFIWPALGAISSYFGPSHPLGIDIDQSATPGAPIWAAHEGVVVFAGGDPCCSYGQYVIVAGANGLATLYGHLDTISVTQGQAVTRGDVLGASGCTGHCTGPHLHFEVIDNGVRRNPLDYLPGGA
jgi:murein DD-endopeptidase MepM/ murein hydrolase activator NlpD